MCGLALTGLWSSYKRIVVQVNPEPLFILLYSKRGIAFLLSLNDCYISKFDKQKGSVSNELIANGNLSGTNTSYN